MHFDRPLTISERLQAEKQSFFELCRRSLPGKSAASDFANKVSVIIGSFFKDLAPGDWAVIGVGGIGRGEMSFISDIDILFLYRKRLAKDFHELIRRFTYSLWDGGFELGHNTLSLSGAISLAKENFSVFTSHITSRLIAGSDELFGIWQRELKKVSSNKGKRLFYINLKEYIRKRLSRYGDSSYLLEPHIKEGIGGLRDVHIIRWISWVLSGTTDYERLSSDMLSVDEKLWLIEAEDFLWQVRLQLHAMTGRRQDQIYFADLERLVNTNLKDMVDPSFHRTTKDIIEEFMKNYYQHTSRIRRVSTFLVERFKLLVPFSGERVSRKKICNGLFWLEGNHIQFANPKEISKNPLIIMKLFKSALESGSHFHHKTGQLIRSNLGLIDDDFRKNPEVIESFFEILMEPNHGFNVLKMMVETGFLQKLIPEFQHVRYRVQYDAYHLYTVDEHLLRTLRELHLMMTKPDPSVEIMGVGDIIKKISNKRPLFLSAFLHDIGKGYEKKHAEHGAYLAGLICERLGLPSSEKKLVVFLIKNHLLLADTALKRDLSDEKPIIKCATIVENHERLDMLYLLTIADSKATGPSAWNTWRASLLRELYDKVRRVLTNKDWHPDAGQVIRDVQERVLKLCPSSEERVAVRRWLDSLSHRYLLSQDPQNILKHFYMEQRISKDNVLVMETIVKENDIWQLTIVTYDRPGLFSIIAGVLWACGINILSADIFTRSSGIAVDVLLVNNIADPLNPQRLWDLVEKDMKMALQDREYLSKIIGERKKSYFFQRYLPPVKPDKVVIDEESSDFYTIIEVYTWDRPGVLYAITDELFKLGLSIQLAKITTPGAQVADIFYVTDLEGSKIMDFEKHALIKERILMRLEKVV